MATSELSPSLKKGLLWGLVFLILGSVGYYVFKDYDFEELAQTLKRAKLQWIVFASLAHLLNHLLRSYRWRLLLKTQKEEVSLKKAYLAEMTGFCINVFPLRAGELGRCKSLEAMHGTPINRSLAAVIMERAVDMAVLGIAFVFALAFYFTDIIALWHKIQAVDTADKSPSFWAKYFYPQSLGHVLLLFVIGVLILTLINEVVQRKKEQIGHFFQELWTSLKAARKATNLSFWALTLLILIFYLLLEYLTFFALEETTALTTTLFPILCVFIVLNMSHLVPISNGAGVYHVLIPLCLAPFGIPKEAGVAYAIITHGIQTFNALVIGGICMAFSFRHMQPKKKRASANA